MVGGTCGEKGGQLMATRLVALLLANGLALWIVARLLPAQVSYDQTWATIIAFAVVLGVLNFLLAPVLRMLTWPISCLTLGLFSLIVSGFVFYLGGRLVSGVSITFLGAIVGAIIASVLNSLILSVLRR